MKIKTIILLIMIIIFSLTACDKTREKINGDKEAEKNIDKSEDNEADTDTSDVPVTPTKTVIGGIVSAEIPENWNLMTGDVVCGDSSFDFIYCSEDLFTIYFSVIRDTQEVEHYKEMIGTGNYGKDFGTVELGEGTWYFAEKVAAGPIGEDTCVIQTFDCNLSSVEIQAVLASLKWVK